MSAPVSNVSSTSTLGSTATLNQSKLNMQQFLQLMTTQLQNQNPLNPMSDAEFFGQMAQLGQVQGMEELNNSAQVQQAQALMGKTVIASNPDVSATGSPVVGGVVKTLSIQNGVYYLGLQQMNGTITNVPMSSIQAVEQAPDLSTVSDLVGKTVTGTSYAGGQASTVQGTVTGVSLVNGVPLVNVKTKDGTIVSLGIDQLTNISST